jgi:hypothetical protein
MEPPLPRALPSKDARSGEAVADELFASWISSQRLQRRGSEICPVYGQEPVGRHSPDL